MSTDIPEVLYVFRSERVLPMDRKPSLHFDAYFIFFKVDGKLTYWLMDARESDVSDELWAWRRFNKEWLDSSYDIYKESTVLGRNMQEAQNKLDMFLLEEKRA